MKDNVYRTIFLIHFTIWVTFPLFTFAAHSSIEDKFGTHRYQEIIETARPPLKSLEKLYLARSYFWLGHLQHVKAILDPKVHRPDDLEDEKRLRNLEGLSCDERSRVFMYLGYSHLNLGNKSKACENFIKAFRLDPSLEFEKGTLWDTRLEEIIKEAKIAAQIELQLDLFVAVDLSTSIPQGQVLRIMDLQRRVLGKLKEGDRVSCYGFGDFKDRDPTIPYPDHSPSSVSIVDSLRTDEWTDFSTLFSRLETSITRREESIDDTSVSQKAVLIISDGKHSVENGEDTAEGKIPQSVTHAIKKFSTSCQNVPIVVVTISEEDKRGLDYARLWTEELESYPDSIGKGLYYGLMSEPQDILDRVFKVITPHRVQMIVTRDPDDENKGDVFIDGSCTVGVLIQSPLPRAQLKVRVLRPLKTSSDVFDCKWERAEDNSKDRFIITHSGDWYEKVKITHLTQGTSSAGVQRSPQIITLTFFQDLGQGIDQDEIGKISVLFKKDQPTLQITRGFDKTVILHSEGDKDLEFQTKIDLSDHPFKLPIPLNITVPKNDCSNGLSKIELIPRDTTGSPGKHEFNLSIKAKRIDGLLTKVHRKDISINFNIDDDIMEDRIDDQVGGINFKLVSEPIYLLYQFNNRFMWILIIIPVIVLIFYPFFAKLYHITSNEAAVSGEEFKVFGNTIYDNRGEPVLRLRQWNWFAYLERVEDNLESDITQVMVLPQSSRKGEKVKTETDNSLDSKFFIWPKGIYQIILEKNGRSEIKFNACLNYTHETRCEWCMRLLFWLGICSIVFVLAWLHVSHPLPILHLTILAVLLLLFVAVFFYSLGRRKQENGLYKASILRSLGSSIGLLDAFVSFLENLQLFI